MKKSNKLLWAIIKSEGYRYEDVGELLGRSVGYIGDRFRGHGSFTINEAYRILHWLDLPEADIYKYFPPQAAANESIVESLDLCGKAAC